MKKRVSILLGIILVAILSIPFAYGDNVYYETTDEVNLRSGAGTNYGIVTTVPKGDVVEVTSRMLKEWWEVRYTNADGKTYQGYISSDCLMETDKRTNEKKASLSKTILSSVKWKKDKGFVIVNWKKNTTGDRFEIQFSSEKSFKFVRQFFVEDNTETSVSIDGVPAGKWYVRIRTISESESKSEFSGWSEVKSVNVPIVPPDVSISKASSPEKGWIKVKWKAVKGISGYQLQVSESKDFKTGKQQKSSLPAKEKDVTMEDLKSKKTYYVRLRTYKKDGSKKYYGEWSKAKSVKVK